MTLRLRGVLRVLPRLVLVCVAAALILTQNGSRTAAQESRSTTNSGSGALAILRGGANPSSSASVGGDNSSSGSYDEVAAYFARGYASTMENEEQRLTIISDTFLTKSVCDGEPMVVLKSMNIPANGACLPMQSRYNLSCSCLLGFGNTTAWSFRIRAPEKDPTASYPATISDGETIEVNSLMLLDVPAELLILQIQGVGSDLVPVTIEHALTGDDDLTIVRSQGTSALNKADISNLDLFGIPFGAGFLPSGLTNLIIRNCNLSSLSQLFLESFTGLQSLNLEANKISGIYDSLPNSADALNAMTEINLANNSFTEFPSQLLQFPNLQKLDLSGNDITNLTVTSEEFATISHLLSFTVDISGVDESDCDSGEWREVHAAKFCVVNGTSSTPTPVPVTTESSNEDSTNWAIFVLVAALGGCVVGFLLFFLATKLVRCRDEHRENKPRSSSPSVEGIQTSRAQNTVTHYDSLHPTLKADLLNNPLIMSFRIKYKDLHVGRCISKGGFGLVYTGVYKHRSVAIKKIMREKCEKLSQIHMFIREITLMGSLKHERIVEFIGVAWDSLRNLSAVTEYMERGDLRDVLHTLKNQGSNGNRGFTWQGRKLTIALHIAEGLAFMHSLNPKVIHRDLKSKNVLLNNDYDAKLSDFGVSRERLVSRGDGDGPGRFMTPGVGTSFWIAPEVLLGKDYDERADIFSFGVVLSEIDTDDYPYWNSGSAPAQDNPNERRSQEQKILEKVALGSLRPTFYNDCPPGVLALAASCLEGRPENRPSAAEIVLTISELIREIQLDNRAFPESEPDEIGTDGFLSTNSSR